MSGRLGRRHLFRIVLFASLMLYVFDVLRLLIDYYYRCFLRKPCFPFPFSVRVPTVFSQMVLFCQGSN